MTYPLVRDLAAEGFLVRLTCRVLGISAPAFYAWNKNLVALRDLENANVTNVHIDAHGGYLVFGYRFLAEELKWAGIEIGEVRDWRLWCQQKPWSTTVKKGRNGKEPGPSLKDDLLRRDFTASRPNRKWVTVLTEHPTADIKVDCSAIQDLFSNRIVRHAVVAEQLTAHLLDRKHLQRERAPTWTRLAHHDNVGIRLHHHHHSHIRLTNISHANSTDRKIVP